MCVCVCVCVSACERVRACMRACVRACVRASLGAITWNYYPPSCLLDVRNRFTFTRYRMEREYLRLCHVWQQFKLQIHEKTRVACGWYVYPSCQNMATQSAYVTTMKAIWRPCITQLDGLYCDVSKPPTSQSKTRATSFVLVTCNILGLTSLGKLDTIQIGQSSIQLSIYNCHLFLSFIYLIIYTYYFACIAHRPAIRKLALEKNLIFSYYHRGEE